MITLLSPNFKPEVVTKTDLAIASLAFGWTLGFGFLTTWMAIRQTVMIHRRYGLSTHVPPYIWMVWLEILVCAIFAIITFLHLCGVIPPSFALFFMILTTWSLQVQFLLQIIINRIAILITDHRRALRIKISVAVIITLINISVYLIWIPARLQIDPIYERINVIWDRFEKSTFLLIDAGLNWYFIRTVKNNLVSQGLTKYDRLVTFNVWIIGFSLSMDLLIIAMMSLPNDLVYLQFHPLAYMVKLKIEMSMAELIAKVATSPHIPSPCLPNTNLTSSCSSSSSSSDPKNTYNDVDSKLTKTFATSKDVNWSLKTEEIWGRSSGSENLTESKVNMRREVHVLVERRNSLAPSCGVGEERCEAGDYGVEDDLKPLKDGEKEREGEVDNSTLTGMDRSMGVSTKVWGPPIPVYSTDKVTVTP